jgi:cytochrome c-type biogenesis protein CcmF
MLAQFGAGVLWLTFLVALFSIAAAAIGYFSKSDRWVETSRRAMQLTFPLITLSALTLISLLVTGHFEVNYVYSVTSLEMPAYLKVTALWGGQAGSLVLWSWLMSAFASAVMFRKWDRDREFLPWVVIVTGLTLAFFLSLTIFFENPFQRLWQTITGEIAPHMFAPAGASIYTPDNGRGLNELLRHPGMIFHPPMLYLGFVAFVIPYAFAIAALVTGRSDDRWIRITRRWTLVAWVFLSIGLVLGMAWAYEVLGWGGYWGWDPVEIAALMPWLVGSPFLHSVMIQEKRGIFKRWNMLLIILTYSLVIFGTFLTRSGVLSSVHAFAESSIGPMFFIFIGVTFVASVSLLIYRWSDLHAEVEIKSLLSREAMFLYNNVLFLCILVICFSGVIAPLISEIFTGLKMTVGPHWYQAATGPFWAGLLALMGICPLAAWGLSTTKTIGRAAWKPSLVTIFVPIMLFAFGIRNWFALLGFTIVAFVIFITLNEYGRGIRARMNGQKENILTAISRLTARNRRRYGGYIIHISIVLMAIGVIGIQFYQSQTQQTVAIGQNIQISGYTLRYDSLAQFPYMDGRKVTRGVLSVFKAGKYLGQLTPRYDLYPDGQPVTIPAIRSTLADDLYVVLVNWENVSTAQTPFKVYHNPLVKWLWIGSVSLVLGFLVAAWPEKEATGEQVTGQG